MTLSIPDGINDADMLTAALAYADAGWYILPVYWRTAVKNLTDLEAELQAPTLFDEAMA